MAVKSTEVTRAEYLTDYEQEEIRMNEGLVILEVRNPELKKQLKPAKNGYTDYLKSLGMFKEDISWLQG